MAANLRNQEVGVGVGMEDDDPFYRPFRKTDELQIGVEYNIVYLRKVKTKFGTRVRVFTEEFNYDLPPSFLVKLCKYDLDELDYSNLRLVNVGRKGDTYKTIIMKILGLPILAPQEQPEIAARSDMISRTDRHNSTQNPTTITSTVTCITTSIAGTDVTATTTTANTSTDNVLPSTSRDAILADFCNAMPSTSTDTRDQNDFEGQLLNWSPVETESSSGLFAAERELSPDIFASTNQVKKRKNVPRQNKKKTIPIKKKNAPAVKVIDIYDSDETLNEGDNKEMLADVTCTICYVNVLDSVLVDCGHRFCYTCAIRAKKKNSCHHCRSKVKKILRTFDL